MKNTKPTSDRDAVQEFWKNEFPFNQMNVLLDLEGLLTVTFLEARKAFLALEWYGREFIQVSRWFPSSQLCNHCGWQNKELKPNEREWTCWNCWEHNERDHNSAKNILEEGLRIRTVGTTGIAYCPDVRPAMSGLLVG